MRKRTPAAQGSHRSAALIPEQAAQRLRGALTHEQEKITLLVGDYGLGKSHLLDVLAAELGTTVVRTGKTEQAFPLSGLSAFLGALRPGALHHLDRYLNLRDKSDRAYYAAAQDILDLIVGLRLEPRPVLIDDLDAMDAQSAAILSVTLNRLAGTGLRVVAAVTDVPDTLANAERVRLGRMDQSDADRIAREHGLADPIANRLLLKYSGGHPRVFRHHLDILTVEQRLGEAPLKLPPVCGGELDDTLYDQLTSLKPDEYEVLLTVALATICPEDILVPLTGHEETVIQLLEDGLLVSRGRYLSVGDDLLRSALACSAEHQERRRRHAALADAVQATHPHLASWHRSFLTTSAMTNELVEAAIWAAENGHLHFAIELAERSFSRFGGRSQDASDAHGRFAYALLHAGEPVLAARYSRWARAVDKDPAAQLRLLTSELITAVISAGHFCPEEAKALATRHGKEHPKEAIQLMKALAALHLDRWQPDLARTALDVLETLPGHDTSMYQALRGLLAAIEGTDPTPITAASIPEALTVMARTHALREQYTAARRLLEIALCDPHLQNRTWRMLARLTSVRNETASGDFRMARWAIEAWLDSRPSMGGDTPEMTGLIAWHRYSTGDLDDALLGIERYLDTAADGTNPRARSMTLALRGTIRLMRDEAEAAVADLRAATRSGPSSTSISSLACWGDYVEACMRTGQDAEARELVRSLERHLQERPSSWGQIVLGRVRALTAPPAERLARMSAHVDALDQAGAHSYEGARSMLCLADLLNEAGEPVRARRTLDDAANVFEGVGATGWAMHARQRVRPVEVPPPPPSALSPLSSEELEIAGLVASGLRNRDIAKQLYLSTRTVELRLTRIYRTLDISSRAELIALLNTDNPAA